MYFNIFQCIYSLPQCISIYFNVFIVCLNVFQYISMYLKVFQYNSMYLNIFTDNIIGISLSHSIYNIFPTRPPTHLFFTIHNDSLPNMLYHYTLLSGSHWSVPTFIQSIQTLHTNFYFSHPYITPHSTFHIPHSILSVVVRSIVEPKLIIHYY
jgi:hypothetical protein